MMAMRLFERPRYLRAALMIPAVAMLSASAGCSTVVSGKAVLAEPQIGQAVE